MKKKYLSFILYIFFTISFSSFAAVPTVARPPQYILLAYDGSLNLDMWNDTLSFAKKNNIKLSYFLSGVYFLLDSNRKDYIEPTRGAGISAIGFGGDSKANLLARVNYVNKAFLNGHTIGSHANGHFEGETWPLEAWDLEFQEFNHLIFDVFNQKGMETHFFINPYRFNPNQIVGFRAPLLSTNANLYKVLHKNNFLFDTSQTSSMDYWPHKHENLWNFPLAQLRIYGTGKETLSMDYNFYYVQSGGSPDLAHAEKYRQEMLKTYMGYFATNYYGNRAPIHIGHHFSKWNGGAYWLAFEDFVKAVCTQPEVQCVSYQTLLNFMNSLTPEQISNYQNGNFPKLPIPKAQKKDIAAVAPIDISFLMKKTKDDKIELSLTGRHAHLFSRDFYYVWLLNNKEFFRSKNSSIKISDIPSFDRNAKLSAVLKFSEEQEMLKTSHMITSSSLEGLSLSSVDLEKRASLGDLPEAHSSND